MLVRGRRVQDGLRADEGVVVVGEDRLFLGTEVPEERPARDPGRAAISSTVVASYPLVENNSIAAADSSRRIFSRWAAARLPAALSGVSDVVCVRAGRRAESAG